MHGTGRLNRDTHGYDQVDLEVQVRGGQPYSGIAGYFGLENRANCLQPLNVAKRLEE